MPSDPTLLVWIFSQRTTLAIAVMDIARIQMCLAAATLSKMIDYQVPVTATTAAVLSHPHLHRAVT